MVAAAAYQCKSVPSTAIVSSCREEAEATECVQFGDVECPWYRELYQVDEFECEDCPVMQEFRESQEMQEEV